MERRPFRRYEKHKLTSKKIKVGAPFPDHGNINRPQISIVIRVMEDHLTPIKSFSETSFVGTELAHFGNPTSPLNQPMLGDVLVFMRNGGGHVTLYVGRIKTITIA